MPPSRESNPMLEDLQIASTLSNMLIASKGSEHLLSPKNLDLMRQRLQEALENMAPVEVDADAARS